MVCNSLVRNCNPGKCTKDLQGRYPFIAQQNGKQALVHSVLFVYNDGCSKFHLAAFCWLSRFFPKSLEAVTKQSPKTIEGRYIHIQQGYKLAHHFHLHTPYSAHSLIISHPSPCSSCNSRPTYSQVPILDRYQFSRKLAATHPSRQLAVEHTPIATQDTSHSLHSYLPVLVSHPSPCQNQAVAPPTSHTHRQPNLPIPINPVQRRKGRTRLSDQVQTHYSPYPTNLHFYLPRTKKASTTQLASISVSETQTGAMSRLGLLHDHHGRKGSLHVSRRILRLDAIQLPVS